MLYEETHVFQDLSPMTSELRDSTLSLADTRSIICSTDYSEKLLVRRRSVDDKLALTRTPLQGTNRKLSRRHSSPVVMEEVGLLGKRFAQTLSSPVSAMGEMDRRSTGDVERSRLNYPQLPQIKETDLDEKENACCEPIFNSTWPPNRRHSEGILDLQSSLPSIGNCHRPAKPSRFVNSETSRSFEICSSARNAAEFIVNSMCSNEKEQKLSEKRRKGEKTEERKDEKKESVKQEITHYITDISLKTRKLE